MQRPSTYALSGGLDVVSPALAVPPSRLISGMNYEPLAEGYGRVDGYERYSGKSAPSDASFWLLDFDGGASAISQNDTITGATSGATGVVVLEPVDFTGSWALGTAAGTLVLTAVSGTFQDNEVLNVSATPSAVVNGTISQDSAPTVPLQRTYLEAAMDYLRGQIAKVPGSGAVRGVAALNGIVYAWRDNAGGTLCKLHKATAAGWVEITLGHTISFSIGVKEILEGQTIEGVTSGATATVERVIRRSGDWGSDAAGYLVLSGITGTFVNENIEDDSNNLHAYASGISQITINPGGRYRTINHNFYGASDRFRMYGCSGVDKGFEFDGTVYVPITTGMVVDKPNNVFEIAQHLGFTFPGGSLQFSGTAEPVLFDPVLGAGEIGMGTECTDVVQATETAVVVFGAQKIGILTGTDADSFQLQELTEEAGADAGTAQRIGKTMYLDRRGLRDLSATQAFGNFKAGTLSLLIEPYFKAKRKAGATPVLSLVSRTKSQYRLFWDDGTGLAVYMGGKIPEAIPFNLNNMQVNCATTTELNDGTEGIFVGSDDGYVYRLDSGPSFDGEAVQGFVMTPFNHLGSAMREDRIHKVTLELQAQSETRIGVIAQFDYGSAEQPISGNSDFNVIGSGAGHDFLVTGGGGNWDSATWNQFYWSAPIEGLAAAPVDGIGVNVSFIFGCNSYPTENSHILQAYTVHHSPRKLRR